MKDQVPKQKKSKIKKVEFCSPIYIYSTYRDGHVGVL